MKIAYSRKTESPGTTILRGFGAFAIKIKSHGFDSDGPHKFFDQQMRGLHVYEVLAGPKNAHHYFRSVLKKPKECAPLVLYLFRKIKECAPLVL